MSERVKAIVTIVVTAGVNIANVCGLALDAEAWVTAALSVASVVCIVISWWRNNNVTREAIQGQLVVDRLKAERKAGEANAGD